MTSGDWPVRWIREQLGYEPRDPQLFIAALTHRSAPGPNNERLEFLGDAVLNLVIARHLFFAFPDGSEGDLSRLRARVVSAEPLAEVAAQIGLGEVLHGAGRIGHGHLLGSHSCPQRQRERSFHVSIPAAKSRTLYTYSWWLFVVALDAPPAQC